MKLGLLAGLVIAASTAAGAAQDMTPPRLKSAPINWAAAIGALTHNQVLRPRAMIAQFRPARGGARELVPAALSR